MQNRSRSLPRNQTMDKMAGELDSDRSYDPLERQIFQMAKQASKEADRMRNVSENSRTAREVTRRGGGGGSGAIFGTLRHARLVVISMQ